MGNVEPPRPGADVSDQVVEGSVKWFDATRGFGFAVSPEIEGDILVHVNVLRKFGQNSVADGSQIRMRVTHAGRGNQAVEVLSIVAPEIDEVTYVDAELPEYLRPVPDSTPYQPARVKWFDKAKGFGFANVFGKSEDIFIHAEVLRRFGLADLTPGEAICLRAVEGARGLLALEVRSWDFFRDE